jgi:putative transcriptional regulator
MAIIGQGENSVSRHKGEGMSKSGKRLIDAAREAVAIARGEKKPARLHVPPEIDVREIRVKLALSQDDFAAEFGFTTDQIRNWEQGRSRPLGGNRAYLMIIKRDPKKVLEILRSINASRRTRKAA